MSSAETVVEQIWKDAIFLDIDCGKIRSLSISCEHILKHVSVMSHVYFCFSLSRFAFGSKVNFDR